MNTISILIITKGHKFIRNVDRIAFRILYKSSDDALYLYNDLWKYFERFCHTYYITKGHNSVKIKGRVKVLVLLTCLKMLAIVRNFMKISWMLSELWSGQDFHTYNYKGELFRKNVCEVAVLVRCTLSDNALHLNYVSWKYLEQFQSYRADTISIFKITKGHNSAQNVRGVAVLVYCTSFDITLHLYRISWKYLEQV